MRFRNVSLLFIIVFVFTDIYIPVQSECPARFLEGVHPGEITPEGVIFTVTLIFAVRDIYRVVVLNIAIHVQ